MIFFAPHAVNKWTLRILPMTLFGYNPGNGTSSNYGWGRTHTSIPQWRAAASLFAFPAPKVLELNVMRYFYFFFPELILYLISPHRLSATSSLRSLSCIKLIWIAKKVQDQKVDSEARYPARRVRDKQGDIH